MHIKFSDFSRVKYIRKQINGSGKLEFRIAGYDRKFSGISGFVSLVQVKCIKCSNAMTYAVRLLTEAVK
jgi:hypothetical protein